jgi:Na+/H+ antiporter NhaC
MLDWASAWLDWLLAVQVALVFCAFFVGVTWLGILVVHPLMRRILHRNEPSNELSSTSPARSGWSMPSSSAC